MCHLATPRCDLDQPSCICAAFYAFCLPPPPVHSDTNSASSGSILTMQQLRVTTKSLTFPPLYISCCRNRYTTIGVVYRCPNITKENNEKIHNAISEVSKGDCIIMGDYNHGNIKWDTLQSTGVEDSTFVCLVQDNFLTQHVIEPTRATRVLDIVLSSQKELLDNVEIEEPLGSSDHNQMHYNINVKSDKTKVKHCRRDFRKGNYKEIRKHLSLIDWNDKMKNKTAAECWNIVRG